MASVKCVLGCGRDVNPYDESTWKEVAGFVGGPKKDSMVLRTNTGNFACMVCIHKARQGQSVDQDSLFDKVTWKGETDPIEDLEMFIEMTKGEDDASESEDQEDPL